MNPSHCIPEQKLAAYFDGELRPDERSVVEGHLRDCGRCRRTVDEMELVRRGVGSISSPKPPEALWTAIEDTLCAQPRPLGERRTPLRRVAARLRAAPIRRRLRSRRLAVVALLVVTVTSILLISRSDFSSLERIVPGDDSVFSSDGNVWQRDAALPVVAASAPFNLGPFLEALDRTNRLTSFPDADEKKTASASDAFADVVRRVELDWAALPSDLVLETASVIERTRFRMAQLVFSHGDGKVILFVQPRSYTISFADHPTESTVMGRRRCLKVRCGEYRAYCFRTEEATYTVVGRHDDPMLQAVYQAVQVR